ncbi:MAG TPA: hypothetical protein PK513_03265 [Alphaproteobacteria bacterium]|nr:hypothetical protein [Alphaproteobacteria bacterium]USO05494.1 MAG: hypothetical protein H6859_10215 [Rhodospirillales bacterium]HOO81505.1 hypothetical protein [Alphaproteobacteria bacterium]
MILNLKTKKSESDASASVVDGKLILSLPDAISPVVWQMDLTQAKASALEVLHDENTGHHVLKLKTPKGETVEVAAFKDRLQAVTGLMAASGALENAHGLIRPPASENTGQITTHSHVQIKQTKKERHKKWLGAVLALVILFILFTLWSATIPKQIGSNGAYAPTSASIDPQTSSGVPVSADAFLGGQ